MDSLNTTADTQYWQQPIKYTFPGTPQIRHKISHFAVDIGKELDVRSREELKSTFAVIFFSLTEDEWLIAEADQTKKRELERLQEEQRLGSHSREVEVHCDSDRLPIRVLDQALTQVSHKEVRKEFDQAIQQRKGPIIEDPTKVSEGYHQVAKESIETIKKEAESDKFEMKYEEILSAIQQSSRVEEIRPKSGRLSRYESLRKANKTYRRLLKSWQSGEEEPESGSLQDARS